jgi:hypothetical protein
MPGCKRRERDRESSAAGTHLAISMARRFGMSAGDSIKDKLDEVRRRAKQVARSRPGAATINVAGRANHVSAINSGASASNRQASASQTVRVRQRDGTGEVDQQTSSSSRATSDG